jgi:hypothetical protein
MKIRLLLIFSMFLSAGYSYSQWSTDPTVNTLVCNVNHAQLLPKTAVTSTGETYITWFDGRSGNLDVYLQKLNINGVPQFAANGMVVSSHPQNSWIGQYDIKVDASDNLLIAFSDKRGASGQDTTVNPYIYKISPSGAFLWGNNGVALSNVTSTYQLWPAIALASDGSVFVTWWEEGSTTSNILTQKVSSGGVLQWANPYVIPGTSTDKNIYPNVVPSDNGSAIVSWCHGPIGGGSFVPDIQAIKVMKLSSAGSPVWTDSIFAHNTPKIPPYVVPQVVSDGNNGAFFSWYYERNLLSITCAVQGINSNGDLRFQANGVNVSTDSTQNQIESHISYDGSGNVYAFWTETDLNQNMYGLTGQKISPSGNLLWTDSGKEFMPLGLLRAPINIINNYNDNSVFVTYILDSTGYNDRIYGFKFDNDGNIVWGPNNISTILSLKYDMVGYTTEFGNSVYVWSDNRTSGTTGTGVWAQNINSAGIIGQVGINQISSEVPDRFSLSQNYPNPFNPTTSIKFKVQSSKYVELKVYDVMGREAAVLVNENLGAGEYEVKFDASKLSSGMYFYKLEADGFSEVKKMMLVK